MANDEPTQEALRLHEEACERGESGYMDPQSGLFVMTSVYLTDQGSCCGSGCRHCPFSPEERRKAGRPNSAPAWPWRSDPDET